MNLTNFNILASKDISFCFKTVVVPAKDWLPNTELVDFFACGLINTNVMENLPPNKVRLIALYPALEDAIASLDLTECYIIQTGNDGGEHHNQVVALSAAGAEAYIVANFGGNKDFTRDTSRPAFWTWSEGPKCLGRWAKAERVLPIV